VEPAKAESSAAGSQLSKLKKRKRKLITETSSRAESTNDNEPTQLSVPENVTEKPVPAPKPKKIRVVLKNKKKNQRSRFDDEVVSATSSFHPVHTQEKEPVSVPVSLIPISEEVPALASAAERVAELIEEEEQEEAANREQLNK
ncbi:hypothetical protein, partial [Serratia marcescens]|uniref:hypothetical protein n=1 Tax=Serratia marcescens TaxID=615 RepID=UPI0028129DCA